LPGIGTAFALSGRDPCEFIRFLRCDAAVPDPAFVIEFPASPLLRGRVDAGDRDAGVAAAYPGQLEKCLVEDPLPALFAFVPPGASARPDAADEKVSPLPERLLGSGRALLGLGIAPGLFGEPALGSACE